MINNHMIAAQRLTISIPRYLYEQVISRIPPRGVSRFISRLLERELVSEKQMADPVAQFLNLRAKLPKKSKNEIKKAIEQGRV